MHNISTGRERTIKKNGIETGKEYIFDEVSGSLGSLVLQGVTYRTSILRENNIRLQEKCFYEDAEYDIYPVQYVNSMIFFDIPVYVYRIGSPTQSVNPQNVVRNINMLNTIVDNLVVYFNNLPGGLSDPKVNYIKKQICRIIRNMYGAYMKMPIGRDAFESIHKFDQRLKARSPILYKASNTAVIRLLRLNIYPVYCLGCKMFEYKRKMRGF